MIDTTGEVKSAVATPDGKAERRRKRIVLYASSPHPSLHSLPLSLLGI